METSKENTKTKDTGWKNLEEQKTEDPCTCQKPERLTTNTTTTANNNNDKKAIAINIINRKDLRTTIHTDLE